MGVKISKSMLAKGMMLFVLLSIGAIVSILLFTTDKDTWKDLLNFKLVFIPVLLILGFIRWIMDGMFFNVMAKHGSKSSVGIWRATSIRLEGNLVASIVPMLVGTFSMHAYLLHKEKLSISESFAITVLRSIIPVFLFLVNIPILLFIKTESQSNQLLGGFAKSYHQFLRVFSLPVAISIVFFIITLFFPNQIKNGVSSLMRWWGRIKFIHLERIIKIEKRIFHEIDQFSYIFWTYLRKKKMMLFRAAGWIFLAFFVDYMIAIAILWGFGVHPPFLNAIAIQFLIRPIIYFAFTPGGAGIWEFTYFGFFSQYLPNPIIGVSVLIWRLMLTYLPCLIGVGLLFREFHTDQRLRHWIVEEGVLPEDELSSLEIQDADHSNH